jgi:hypothetical protein
MARSPGDQERRGAGNRVVLFIAIYFAVFLVLGRLGRLIGFSPPLIVGAAVQIGVTVLIYVAVRRRASGEAELPTSGTSNG